MPMPEIRNFLRINNQIASSGQPAAEDFVTIANEGFTTVINLAMPDSDNALPDEAKLVTATGKNYIQIPVRWENPLQQQFGLFATVLQQQGTGRVWVHCVLNMRVAVFLYLYQTLEPGLEEQKARNLLEKIWQPNQVWSDFIRHVQCSWHDRVDPAA